MRAGESGFTTFSFTTSLFTGKTPTGWKLAFVAPAGAAVAVYMPPYSMIDNPFPEPKSVSADSSRTLIQYDDPGPVTIYYTLGEQPAPAQADPSSLYIVATALIIAVAIVAASVILKLPGKPLRSAPADSASPSAALPAQPAPAQAPTLELTPGKKEMMETFNENDLKIVNLLLSSEGKSRRNELERKSGISKSSLAMALNRLEKRKIIEIDRTATTHFVKLADYFLRL